MASDKPAHHGHALKQLMIALLAEAKSGLSDADFGTIRIEQVKSLAPLLAESIPYELLLDKPMLSHAAHLLAEQATNETILMHLFLLSIYRRYSEGTQHPLEKGVLRQKVMSLLPEFEKAVNRGKIPLPVYDRNADALSHFADDTADVSVLLTRLAEEYRRYDEGRDA